MFFFWDLDMYKDINPFSPALTEEEKRTVLSCARSSPKYLYAIMQGVDGFMKEFSSDKGYRPNLDMWISKDAYIPRIPRPPNPHTVFGGSLKKSALENLIDQWCLYVANPKAWFERMFPKPFIHHSTAVRQLVES